MKFLEHIKLAGFTGLLVGAAHGTIDIIIRIGNLRFEWFEFYQQIVHPSGRAESFVDAVRNYFGNEASYREALQPFVEAEKKVYEVANQVGFATVGALYISLNAKTEVRETSISYLFPKQLSE